MSTKTFRDLKKDIRIYHPALVLESLLSHSKRRHGAKILDWLLLFFLISVLASAGFFSSFSLEVLRKETIERIPQLFFGLLLVTFAFRALLFLLEAFYHSYYFQGRKSILQEKRMGGNSCMQFEVGSVIFNSKPRDITIGFLKSSYGRKLQERLGINKEDVSTFLDNRKKIFSGDDFKIEENGCLTLSSYGAALFSQDEELSNFFYSKEIQEEDFVGVLRWIEYEIEIALKKERYWSRDSLARFGAFAEDWAYGETWLLNVYGNALKDTALTESTSSLFSRSKDVEKLETILSKEKNAHAILVSPLNQSGYAVITNLAGKVQAGKTLLPLQKKLFFFLRGEEIIASKKEKGLIEEELIRVFTQAERAGNIILVLEHFPAFLQSALSLGVDVLNVIDPFLRSSRLQIIALSDPKNYHALLESRPIFRARFETIFVERVSGSFILHVLENEALLYERRGDIFFTYSALRALQEGVLRHYENTSRADKAIDLLRTFVSYARKQKKTKILKKDINEFLTEETGVPTGKVTDEEKEKLLNLETLLHDEVIGQDEAVSALSNAMRRSRAQVRNLDRPMGSFLFLGPTGVGKTKTAKVLASLLFGREDAMIRLDMSEYQNEDALSRFTGSFGDSKRGTFTTLLREHPYGVILLDEFEKTHASIHDLFLQILDEGAFSDMEGTRVRVKDYIIIATSNAASASIWKLSEEGKELLEEKNNLVEEIIEKKIFKPELINRFDGVVVFHPLEKIHLEKIAHLELGILGHRLKKQGITLNITDDLVSRVVEKGYSPQFGARPMRRAIKELVENVVAKKLLEGEIKPGSEVTL